MKVGKGKNIKRVVLKLGECKNVKSAMMYVGKI